MTKHSVLFFSFLRALAFTRTLAENTCRAFTALRTEEGTSNLVKVAFRYLKSNILKARMNFILRLLLIGNLKTILHFKKRELDGFFPKNTMRGEMMNKTMRMKMPIA